MFMKISTLIASACFYAKSFLLVLRSILLRLSVPIYFAWQLIKQTSERTQSLRNSHSLRRKSKICSFCLACKIQADALRKDGSNEIYNWANKPERRQISNSLHCWKWKWKIPIGKQQSSQLVFARNKQRHRIRLFQMYSFYIKYENITFHTHLHDRVEDYFLFTLSSCRKVRSIWDISTKNGAWFKHLLGACTQTINQIGRNLGRTTWEFVSYAVTIQFTT